MACLPVTAYLPVWLCRPVLTWISACAGSPCSLQYGWRLGYRRVGV